MACDPHGDITLEAAQSVSYSAFPPGMPTSEACEGYWLHFALEATSSTPGGWLLEFPTPWRHVDLYGAGESGVTEEYSGTARPPQDRVLASGDMAIPLPLTEGSPRVFYLHVVGNTSRFGESRIFDPIILRLDSWFLRRRTLLYAEGIYAGIIIGLVLYNLILYLAIRERVYLYYVLYVASFAMVWIARSGFDFEYLWPQHPVWNAEYQPFVAALAIIFSALFVREFLATRRYSPRVDLVLRGIVVLTPLICLANLAGLRFDLPMALALIGLSIMIIYAALGLVALVRGYRPARFFLVAWTALIVGNVIYIFMFLRLLPNTFLTYNAAQAGSAAECILLAFALADRVNLLKRAREERQMQYTHELQEQVQQRTGELSDAVERLKAASVTDPLTGLSNRRRHVDAAIQPWIANLLRARVRGTNEPPQRSLAICLADLDHFKAVNDEWGHATGDRVLQAAAETLRQNVRATAILARWGGEEFLILDHVTGPYEDMLMAERLRRSIMQDRSPVIVETGRLLSLSLGVVRYPFSEAYPDLLDWDHCLVLADHALYRAKKAGRNRWRCYRSNEATLESVIHQRGAEEVGYVLRLHTDEAFSLGLVEVIDQMPSGVEIS